MPTVSLESTLQSTQTLEPVRVKVSEKGRVVLPIQFREAVGIKVGDVVNLELVDNELRISTFSSRLEKARARLRRLAPQGVSVVDELIAERRAEAKREEDEAQEWLTKRSNG